MKRVVTVVGIVGLLSGCASSPTQSPWLISRAEQVPAACAALSQDQELTLNLAQRTADEGRLHAALANLERLPGSLPQARLSKARILRSLNRPEAGELYASLLGTCLKAQGEHGLGQLASAAGRNEEALRHLRLAASLDPTSDTVRNDLGVVYLNLGRLDEARFELLTAMELNEAEKQPALNLLTLLIHQGQLQQASALVDRLQLSPGQWRAAEQRAKTLRSPQSDAAAKPPAKSVADAAPATVGKPPASPSPSAQPAVPAVGKAAVVEPAAAAAQPARVSVAKPAPAPGVVKAPVSAVAPVAQQPAHAVPAPQLTNFRPTPLPVASSAVANAPRVQVSAPDKVTPLAIRVSDSQPAAVPVEAVPRAAPALRAPVTAGAPAVSVNPAPDRSLPATATPTALAAKPAPFVSAARQTTAATRQGSPAIELRPGRLIISDDGVVRVEPVNGQHLAK